MRARVLKLVGGLAATLAAVVAAPAPALNLTPILSCIDLDPSGTSFTAEFGYVNLESNPVDVLYGATNYFLPLPAVRLQPTFFDVGVHERAFSISYSPTASDPDLIWFLNGTSARASLYSPRCGPVCHDVQASSATPTADVTCSSGETLTAGGGRCDNTLLTFPVQWAVGQVQASEKTISGGVQGWHVSCRIGNATASATCCL